MRGPYKMVSIIHNCSRLWIPCSLEGFWTFGNRRLINDDVQTNVSMLWVCHSNRAATAVASTHTLTYNIITHTLPPLTLLQFHCHRLFTFIFLFPEIAITDWESPDQSRSLWNAVQRHLLNNLCLPHFSFTRCIDGDDDDDDDVMMISLMLFQRWLLAT